ncbi:MAG: S8 family serine peptidase, partial [Thermoanaerobaculia bacterium]|nr:S8 family serine peptidase [Thermoanaerobaculia bacterium]
NPGAVCGQTQIGGVTRYSYARGTSFAAPAVSGAIALKGKQFKDGTPLIFPEAAASGIEPHPTLLKAALVATAQSLGPRNPLTGLIDCTAGNCRPSHEYGWGLVDLDRLTDRNTGVYVHNAKHAFTAAGQSWVSPFLEAWDPAKEVLIALVWHDVPPDGALGFQTLRRDLDLKILVPRIGADGQDWYQGNNMEENTIFIDSGYSYNLPNASALKRDGRNNVEVIFLKPNTLSQNQEFRITVTTFAYVPNQPAVDQVFSIYVWNARCWDNSVVYQCD